ncbi:B3 domain-containing transcription factor VRN1-like [Arachis hypogaea]|nr:B3 domain-containing transcription factor VRN1-like [Arachis hypogaea]
MDAGRRRPLHALGHIGRNNDVVRVIKLAGDPSRPLRTYKIGCSPNVLGEIMLEGGWERFYRDYKLRPNNILLLKHKGLDDFDVRIFELPGVERSYVPPRGESSNRGTPQVPNTSPLHQPRTGCINIPRSAAASEVAQTFRSDHPFFVMHITRRLLRVYFLPNVPHFGHDVGDNVMVTLHAGDVSVQAAYSRYGGKRRGKGEFVKLCNINDDQLAVFEISRTNPKVVLLVQFVDYE